MFKKIASVFLSLTLLTSFVQSSHVTASELGLSTGTTTAVSEQKIYSHATLEADFVENHVLVMLTNDASLSFKSWKPSDFSEVDTKSVQSLMPYTDKLMEHKVAVKRNATISASTNTAALSPIATEDYHQILCLELDTPGKENVIAAIKTLEKRADILFVGPDYYLYADIEPNDTYRSKQWAITKIGLPSAWDISIGSTTVSVGIIDSGINLSHPDLSGRVHSTLSTSFQGTGSYGTDTSGHGTKVAGVTAARTHNYTGVSGVCWNIKLVSLKVTTTDKASTSAITLAIDYAEEHDIDILNCSYSTDVDQSPQSLELASLINSIQNYSGLFICCAGNNSTNIDQNNVYPASLNCSNLICVGSSTENDTIASHSNFGSTDVDIFAPGEGILTCAPCLTGCSTCNSGNTPTPGYHSVNGTSLATPYVAGVAALIMAKYPNLTPEQVKDRIMDNVELVYNNYGVSVFSTYCVSGGRLNAYWALHNHNKIRTNDYFATTHLVSCSCGYNRREDHTFEDNGNGYVCSECGYYSDIIPS